MKQTTLEQKLCDVMSGAARGIGPTLARAMLGAAEPLYAGLTSLRNRGFDRGTRVIRKLPRPVISIGNLTTGGTGKTPAVQWLAGALLARGHRPAVLLRGYKRAGADVASDEEQLLRDSLGCIVVADPDRYHGGCEALQQDAAIDVFVLDDGFQHRRLHRDLDIVLIDATNPFGYGHVLPRGMLREQPTSLARADLILLTRSDLVDSHAADAIERTVRSYHSSVPIVRTAHTMTSVRGGVVAESLVALRDRPVFAFSGIGNPAAFEKSLSREGVSVVGVHRFGDHHAYQPADTSMLVELAQGQRASLLLTTDKDWVKVSKLVSGAAIPVACVGLRLAMAPGDEERLLDIVKRAMAGVAQ